MLTANVSKIKKSALPNIAFILSALSENEVFFVWIGFPRKLNVHKTFRRRPGRLLNALCTFNLRPVSTGLPFKISKYIF